MCTNHRCILFGVVLALICIVSYGATAKTINGQEYQQVGSVWYLVDDSDVSWEIAPKWTQIKFNAGVTETQRDTFASNHDLVLLPVIVPGGYYRYEYDTQANPIELLEDVFASPIVDDAELDTYIVFFGAPNDEYYSNQWNLPKMDLERAWDITTGDSLVTVAIFDQGVQKNHEDLMFTRWENPADTCCDGLDNDNDFVWYGDDLADDYWGWDFVGNDNDPSPSGPHGTAVAGTAVANRNNYTTGIAGVAGGDAEETSVKWLSVVANTNFTVLDGIRYCRHKGVDIVNMSVGFDARVLVIAELDSLYMSGTLIFAASGNGCELGGGVAFPARHDSVIAIGATDDDDVCWDWSCNGEGYPSQGSVELMAPSGDTDVDGTVHLYTTDNTGGYIGYNPEECACPDGDNLYFSKWGGTSAASPSAAGIAALLLSYNPALTNREVRQVMRNAAVDLGDPGKDDEYGFGRVDAYRTLTQWGTIASDTTWVGDVYVSGDVTVDPGVTLTIAAGTDVFVMPDDNEKTGADTTRVEFWIKGFLDVNGTNGSPVRFLAWDESGEVTDSTEWWGIFVKDTTGSGADFDYCTIKNAKYGLQTNAGIAINDCTIEHCALRGVSVAYADSVHIEDTTIRETGPSGIGLNVVAGSTLRIADSRIEDIGTNAAQVLSGSKLYADGTEFLDSDKGLYIYRDDSLWVDAKIEDCTFKHNDIGIHAKTTGTGVVIVKECLADSNTTNGIYCESGANIGIKTNTIKNSAVGVFCYASIPWIKNRNVIQNNTSGIKCDTNAHAVVESTTVTLNGGGIVALNNSVPCLGIATGGGSDGYNIIHSNTSHWVSNLTQGVTIMAERNYWNSSRPPCQPKASKIYGSVDVDSALCSAPSLSPIRQMREEKAKLPSSFVLEHNYPNPFNPTTTIRYQVPPPGGHVKILIYNVRGQLVKTLVNGQKKPNFYAVVWDGASETSGTVATGIYFVRMTATGFQETKKILLLK